MVRINNVLAVPNGTREGEVLEQWLEGKSFTLERIVSTGQVTEPGQWYDQARDEWVVLLVGRAVLQFEQEATPLAMGPGDCVQIPAHCRHRVEWTDPDQTSIWLAIHFESQESP